MRPHAQPRRVLRHATGGGGISATFKSAAGVNHSGPSSVSLSNVSSSASSSGAAASSSASSSELDLLELEESDPEDIEASGTGALACRLGY